MAAASERPQVTVRIGLRHRDMDELNHLNQSVYHELLEEGRMKLLADEGGVPFVLARVELDHVHEVRYADGHVDVRAWVAKVGTKSIVVDHEIVLPGGTIAARGTSVLVAWDRAARGSRELTADERARLGG